MPQVIQTFGLDPLAIGFVTAIPYLVASIGMVLMGLAFGRDRRAHLAHRAAVSPWRRSFRVVRDRALPLALTMIALTLATLGIFAAIGTFWSLPTAILTGTAPPQVSRSSTRSAMSAACRSRPHRRHERGNGRPSPALLFLAGALLVGACIALLFGRVAWHRLAPLPAIIQLSHGKPWPHHRHLGLVECRVKPAMTKRIDDGR